MDKRPKNYNGDKEFYDFDIVKKENDFNFPTEQFQSPIFKTIKSVNNENENELNCKTPLNNNQTINKRDYLEKAGNLRWLILALSCFIMFGNFYAYDNPSALNRQLRTWMADKSEAEFEFHLNLLYTVYSAPNIILPFVVGRSLDRYGSRSFLIWLSLLMCLGQTIFSLGVAYRTWTVMLLGRLIFGLGGESLAVAQSRLVTEWFLRKELGIAIGLNLSIARIGTVFNNNASPRIAAVSQDQGGGVSGACWAGLVTCLFSLCATLCCIFIDSLYRPNDNNNSKFKRFDSREDTTESKLLKSKSSLDNDEEFIHPAFYLLLILNFLSYGAVLCFNTVASAYIQERYFPKNIFKANWAMSIPDTAAIFMVPLIGFAVDRSGLKLTTIAAGQAALAFGHLWLAISKAPAKPYISLFVLGIGYSTLLAIWSCVPYLIGSRRQATAYGFLTSSTNVSSTILPIFVAALVSSDQTYFRVGLFFSLLGATGLIICIQVSNLNTLQTLGLNSSRVPNHMVSFYNVKDDPKVRMGSRSIFEEAPGELKIFRSKRNQIEEDFSYK